MVCTFLKYSRRRRPTLKPGARLARLSQNRVAALADTGVFMLAHIR